MLSQRSWMSASQTLYYPEHHGELTGTKGYFKFLRKTQQLNHGTKYFYPVLWT